MRRANRGVKNESQPRGLQHLATAPKPTRAWPEPLQVLQSAYRGRLAGLRIEPNPSKLAIVGDTLATTQERRSLGLAHFVPGVLDPSR